LRLLVGISFPLLAMAGPSQALAASLSQRFSLWLLSTAAYFLIFSTAYSLWLLPLNFYQGFLVEKRFGLSTEGPVSWFGDWLKGLAVSAVIGLPIVSIVYWLLRSFPIYWWVLAATVVTLFAVVLANLAPVLIYPLFFKFEPLGDEGVRDRLAELARRSGTAFSGIYRMELSAKSTEAEAMLTGMGRTRRIILSDTLLDSYTLDEVEVVLAHELGHHAKAHLPLLVAAQTAGTFAALYFMSLLLRLSVGHLGLTSVHDVANLPLLLAALSFLSTLSSPAGNWMSRRLEARADEFALTLTAKPAAFATAMTKLADQNLADLSPHPLVELLLYSHPSVGKRIEAASRFAAERGLAGPPSVEGA